LDTRTTLRVDYNHLDQSGAKLSSFGMAGRAFSTTVAAGGESAAILPTPTNYKTDTMNAALNWRGDKSYWSLSYFGSFFREGSDRLTSGSFYTATAPVQTMSTAPSNSFHQLGMSGGYQLTPSIKLAGNVSFGRNTQNDTFVVDPYLVNGTNRESLSGLVASTHADLKLTNQYSKDLVLSAAVKYDLRDNQTRSDIYNFHSIGNTTAHNAKYPNTPLSTDKAQAELAGDYKLQKDHYIRTTLENTNVSRWCSSYATGASVGLTTYPAGTNCVVATHSQENKVGVTYRLKTDDDVAVKFGYSYSDRVTDSDPYAIAAFYAGKGVNPAGVVTPGYNGGDFNGFHPFFDGNRIQKIMKSSVNWQADEQWNLGVGGKYGRDSYETTYGVQNGNTWMLNLDADYAYSPDGTISFYVTQQYRDRTMDNINAVATTSPVADAKVWRNRLRDQDTTIGFSVKQGGLMSGRLQVVGDWAYTDAKTSYATAAVSGVNPCTVNNTCGETPEITTTVQVFKLSGIYTIDKSSKVAVKLVHQQLSSKDYFYNGYQLGTVPTSVMPTLQQAPNYSLNAVGVSFIHNY
jgi:MtrB/PioB family decaheme-associated outer membrane protein